MRRILVDFAGSRGYRKRGGHIQKIELDEKVIGSPRQGADLIALDDALNALAAIDARQAQVVELRFFGGLIEEETAEALRISSRTVKRDWALAKAWLAREMAHGVKA
jgi:RNA polymerase sigma factor (TIGR02999 family)